MLRSISLFIILLLSISIDAQIVPIDQQVQQELENRGVSLEELQALMDERGIDINNLQDLSPFELGQLQLAIEQIEFAKVSNDGALIDTVPTEDILIDEQELDSLNAITNVDSVDVQEYAIYGHQLVNQGSLDLIEDQAYNPPSYYRVGVGDQIAISIFGRSQLDETLEVLSDGSIMIRDGRVKIYVKGLTVSQMKAKILKNYKSEYAFRDNQFNVSISTVRTITVNVYGEVKRSGSYTISAVNSILNVISAAGGFNDLGSVRRIKLMKKDGQEYLFDLYELLADPGKVESYFLEDGDLIFVPTIGNVVSIEGAINRSDNYELIEGEGIKELINYSGGLAQGAYLTSLRLLRYEESRRVVKSIPYASLVKSRSDYELINGDLIEIDSIAAQLENYVSIVGEVRNPGIYERTPNMRIVDLVDLGRLKVSSKSDFSFLKRMNEDGQISMIPINIDDIIASQDPLLNLELRDQDELTVWAKERFTDDQYIIISGAVRNEERIEYDKNGGLRASDAILMAGGLRRDAAAFAHVHRVDPLNPSDYDYVRLDIDQVMSDANSADNIYLQPFDSVYIYSKNEFYDEINVKISGAVNNPGEFAYGEGMTLKDIIILASGFKRSSATNAIEVSRVILEDNQKTKTVVKTLTLSREELIDFNDSESSFELEPYDNIFVRYVPEFELQQNVLIEGEVSFPGEYSIIKENETIYDLVSRAGGPTEEAFPPGATLYRSEDSLGFIVMRMEEILKDYNSRYNYTLKNGDVIILPKRQDYVTIAGATNIQMAQNQDIVGFDNTIRVPYHDGKNALFYIKEYAGGFAENARKDKVWVTYPNGEVKTTESKFPFGKKHPLVLQGSIINVGKKPIDLYGDANKEDVNWTKVLGDSVAQAMSILTLVLLVQRLD